MSSSKKIAITGWSGFIGSALAEALENRDLWKMEFGVDNVIVERLQGDVRNPETFAKLDHTYDYLFHLAAPSSQILFKRNPALCIGTTIDGTRNAAHAAQKHGIRLIYPSTGLLSSDRYNEYAMCKKIMEDYVQGLSIDATAVRIFATYGPGEGHKADYASVPYLFARDILSGVSPVVWGDGNQTRDLIYISDTVNALIAIAECYHGPRIDVGSGEPISFNQIIKLVRKNTDLGMSPPETEYVDAPAGYVENTAADTSELAKFYEPLTDVDAGIRTLSESIKRGLV